MESTVKISLYFACMVLNGIIAYTCAKNKESFSASVWAFAAGIWFTKGWMEIWP
jgi:hypothetical protein